LKYLLLKSAVNEKVTVVIQLCYYQHLNWKIGLHILIAVRNEINFMFDYQSTNHSNLHLGLNPNMVFLNQNTAYGLETLHAGSINTGAARASYDLEPRSNDLAIRGTTDRDYLVSGSHNSKLYGFAGNDVLIGNRGDDLLKGGTGQDFLVGRRGNDLLLDEDGGDRMVGGRGADQFAINFWAGPSTPSQIVDFKVGTDKIKIGRLGATFDQLSIQDSPRGVLIREGNTTIAFVWNVRAADLKPNSFMFGDPELARQLQRALDQNQQASGVPGLTNAVVTPDGYTWQGAAGVSDLKSQMAMRPDDILNIGSVTKVFTAATVLKVVEDGKISLDDTLGQWLPDIAKNLLDSENVTLRQLLDGSGGIFNYTESEQSAADIFADYQSGSTRNFRPEDWVSYAYGQPRFSGPTSSSIWAYPNTGNILAALMLEKATGSSFAELMRAKILEPLGLKQTFFVRTEPIVGNQARGYADLFRSDGSIGSDGVLEDLTVVNKTVTYGDAGLVSTAQDVARFTQAVLGGELLKSASLKQMVTFVNEGIPFEGDQYGLGVVNYNKVQAWGKGGDFPGYRAEMRYLPNRGGATAVALQNQSRSSGDVVTSIVNGNISRYRLKTKP